MRILLVRHGESEGNADRKLHHLKADHALALSALGREQATRTGEFLAKYLYCTPTFKLGSYPYRLWTSPYARARETADNIKRAAPPDFGYREHTHLAEQQFGLFDGLEDDELQREYPREHAHYKKCQDFGGRFWARMPLGESRFDVALRVHESFGTFLRDEEKHKIDTIVVVCHGTTIRAFVMQWLHLPVEWFEKEPNPMNGSVRLIDNRYGNYVDRGVIYSPEGTGS